VNADGTSPGRAPGETQADPYVQRHLRFGWLTLGVFALLGVVLESLHGFKIGWYLDVSNETRRLMWTLAHTHGTLLALVNIAFAATVFLLPARRAAFRAFASRLLRIASVAMPLGFLIGGLFPIAGDPHVGILLVPVGSVLLLIAIALATP
jgi:hypothetical protein